MQEKKLSRFLRDGRDNAVLSRVFRKCVSTIDECYVESVERKTHLVATGTRVQSYPWRTLVTAALILSPPFAATVAATADAFPLLLLPLLPLLLVAIGLLELTELAAAPLDEIEPDASPMISFIFSQFCSIAKARRETMARPTNPRIYRALRAFIVRRRTCTLPSDGSSINCNYHFIVAVTRHFRFSRFCSSCVGDFSSFLFGSFPPTRDGLVSECGAHVCHV